jgi:hypothetical protein
VHREEHTRNEKKCSVIMRVGTHKQILMYVVSFNKAILGKNIYFTRVETEAQKVKINYRVDWIRSAKAEVEK